MMLEVNTKRAFYTVKFEHDPLSPRDETTCVIYKLTNVKKHELQQVAAVSWLHPIDFGLYDKFVGMKLALQKVMNENDLGLTKEERKQFWEVFNNEVIYIKTQNRAAYNRRQLLETASKMERTAAIYRKEALSTTIEEGENNYELL